MRALLYMPDQAREVRYADVCRTRDAELERVKTCNRGILEQLTSTTFAVNPHPVSVPSNHGRG